MDDARVAAGAIGEPRSDIGKKFFRRVGVIK